MNKRIVRFLAAATLAIGSIHFTAPRFAMADEPQQQLATAEDYRSAAIRAARDGQFERTTSLMTKASELAKDPLTLQMAEWCKSFEAQRTQFAAERHKQHVERVEEAKKLIDAKLDGFAIDSIAGAYLLADNRDAFTADPWVASLIDHSVQLAADAEAKNEWVKSGRIYSDLVILQPSKAEWKDKLKVAQRRVNVLGVYAPDQLKSLVEVEVKEKEAADRILRPDKAPTTKPAREDNDAFKLDWNDTLKGVRLDMLREALKDARDRYWRDVNNKVLALGGLKGLEVLVTTPGLEKTFAGLADEKKRDEFVAAIKERVELANTTPVANDGTLVKATLDRLVEANKSTVNLPENVLTSEFATGAFAELDPFSSMLWPYDLKEFNKSTQGEFIGVGIQIESDKLDGRLRVQSPLEDSPAFKAGVRAGEHITRIDGKSTQGITTSQAVNTITGTEGTKVTLTLENTKGEPRDLTITRTKIKVTSLKGWERKPGGAWDYFIDPEQKIAYVRLTSFSKTTADELTDAVAKMEAAGAKGLILDLRYNPGGLLSAAAAVCDKFLTGGTIVSTRPDDSRRNGENESSISANEDANDSKLPLIVLVNQYSASASEIVSGALKDTHRAQIVGERTFGKGSVQMVFPVSRDILNRPLAVLKLTTSHYYLPNGRCIHREENSTTWGVEPDVTIDMTPEQMSAAIDAQRDQEVLTDETFHAAPSTQPAKSVLSVDPQLHAALLMLRLQVAAGAV